MTDLAPIPQAPSSSGSPYSAPLALNSANSASTLLPLPLTPRETSTISAPDSSERGFTLIELMIVMAIIGLLAAIAVPRFLTAVTRAKEAVLREDLHTMRTAIDSYTVDKEKAPQGLDDLVQAGYLKTVPIDPITSRNDTWITGQSGSMTDITETEGGIDDVHSGAQSLATDGTTYNTW